MPALRHDSSGPSWSAGPAAGASVPISRFFIATPTTPVLVIDAALALGKNLLLTPGVYDLKAPIPVSRPNTIVLGLGFPTLVPQNGAAAMQVLGVPGVVNSSHVILDDIWAWRADHAAGAGWISNTADNGRTVNGNDVTAYGLAVEHYQKNDVVWNGQGGADIFFQNEMPYDAPRQAAWMSSPTTDGYPAFVISPRVTSFSGYGLGSYCYFDQGVPIQSATAFSVPDTSGIQLHDVFTRFLNGSGSIDHVVNSTGAAVTAANPGPSDVVSYP